MHLDSALLAGVFGLIIGSFLNVCIYRLPKEQSVVRPRSRCTNCSRPIPAWENIPVLSYVLLRGKCRGCGTPIGWVYPTVELLTGVVFFLLAQRFGLSPAFFVNVLFCAMLIVLIFIDLFERILPDPITLGGAVLGFVLSPLQSPFLIESPNPFFELPGIAGRYLDSALGMALGGGFLWLVAVLYLKLRKIEGMGFGDIKMMLMVGAFIGWQYAWLTILLGSMLGAVIGGGFIILSSKGRRYELPFGTFLGAAAIICVLYGPNLLNWYMGRLVS